MKLFIVLTIVLASTLAQRGTYSGSRIHGVADVAYRFRNRSTNSPTNTANNANSNPNNGNTIDNSIAGTSAFNNRWNDNSPKMPVDSSGNIDYSKLFANWPRENIPFWYVNREAINQHKGRPNQFNSVNTNNAVNAGNPQATNGAGLQTRFNSNTAQNSFSVVRNGNTLNYEYDPLTDSWKPRRQ